MQRSATILFLLAFCVSISFAQTSDWNQELRAAADQSNEARLKALMEGRRLDVKPELEAWITDALKAPDSERNDRFLAATNVAEAFQSLFDEVSLSNLVRAASGWNEDQVAKKLEADSLYANAVERRGIADEREDARTTLLEAEALYRAIGDEAGLGATLGQLGYLSWFLDRPSYLTYNEQALELRRKVNDQQLIGNTLNDLGLYHRAIARDFEKALDVYLESESVRWTIGDSVALSRTLPNIALSYEGIGDFDKALEYYEKGGRLYLAVGDTARYIGQRNNAAGILTDVLERHSDALVEMLRLKEELREINDPRTEALVTNSIGVVSRRLGDYQTAIAQYQDVIAISEEHGFDDLLAGAYNNIGVVYIWIGRPERSVSYFERARDLYGSMDEPGGRLDALINLGSAAFETKAWNTSTSYLEDARSVAMELGDDLSMGTIETGLGNSLLRGSGPDAAIPHYTAALDIARDYEIPDLVMGALFGLGDAAEQAGKAEEALAWYSEAISTLENARGLLRAEEDKAGYLAQTRYLFEDVIDFMTVQAIETNDAAWTARAFNFAEQAKARAFVDQLAEALADVSSGVDADLLEEQQILTDNLTWLRDELSAEADRIRRDELKAMVREQELEFQRVEGDLRERNTAYADLRYPEPVMMAGLQSRLGADEVVLSYSVGDSSSTLWAIGAENVSIHQLPTRADLSPQVDLLRFALQDPSRTTATEYGATAAALYDTLLRPAENMLDGATNVIIMADDILNYVPFEALVAETGDSYSTLSYFLEQADISYVQSATVLAQLSERKRPEPDREFLAVGNPDFGGTNELSNLRGNSLQQLPFALEEVDSIAGLFASDESDVFTGADASESRILESVRNYSYRYVHFATHGLINDDRPDYSALALATGSTPGEGLLQASEIFNLRLNADLVVLSACETGLGQLVQGEGMVGLTRAFMYAGASSLVVSLWSVADASTASLMQHFYQNLLGADLSRSDALSKAKKSLIQDEETAHPFHWAPFILIGEVQSSPTD